MVILSYSCGLLSFFFFKQKTAYVMRISDWSSDVCSSDLAGRLDIVSALMDLHSGGSPISPLIARKLLTRMRDALPVATDHAINGNARSEERRGGKECVSTCRSRWAPYH